MLELHPIFIPDSYTIKKAGFFKATYFSTQNLNSLFSKKMVEEEMFLKSFEKESSLRTGFPEVSSAESLGYD